MEKIPDGTYEAESFLDGGRRGDHAGQSESDR